MVTTPLQDSTNKCTVSVPVQESAIVIVEGAEVKDIPSPFPFPLHYPVIKGRLNRQCDAAVQKSNKNRY